MSTIVFQARQLLRGLQFKRRPVAARLFGFALVASGIALGTNAWVGHFSKQHIYREASAIPAHHTAIVPGCRVYTDGTPTATLEDRLAAALELYRLGKVKKILVSGDHAAPEYDEVNAMWAWLRDRGVPARDVFLDHAGLRTLDTMKRARDVFKVESAIICTQEFHLPRSVFLARRAGFEAAGLVADRRKYQAHNKNLAREFVARSVSFADSYIFNTGPKYSGEEIPISGDGRVTHDRFSK